jgi:hypothetical protein
MSADEVFFKGPHDPVSPRLLEANLMATAAAYWVLAGYGALQTVAAFRVLGKLPDDAHRFAEGLEGVAGIDPHAGLLAIGIGNGFLVLFSIVAAFGLAGQRMYKRCQFTALLACFLWPFGTVLGVYTLFLLFRAEARDAFARNDLQEPEEDRARPSG